MRTTLVLALLLLAGCSGVDDSTPVETPNPTPPMEVEACDPAPAGFVVWTSPDSVVHVSKKLTGTIAGGIELHAEIHHLDPATLPAVVDFGSEQIEVRADLTLCLQPTEVAQ